MFLQYKDRERYSYKQRQHNYIRGKSILLILLSFSIIKIISIGLRASSSKLNRVAKDCPLKLGLQNQLLIFIVLSLKQMLKSMKILLNYFSTQAKSSYLFKLIRQGNIVKAKQQVFSQLHKAVVERNKQLCFQTLQTLFSFQQLINMQLRQDLLVLQGIQISMPYKERGAFNFQSIEICKRVSLHLKQISDKQFFSYLNLKIASSQQLKDVKGIILQVQRRIQSLKSSQDLLKLYRLMITLGVSSQKIIKISHQIIVQRSQQYALLYQIFHYLFDHFTLIKTSIAIYKKNQVRLKNAPIGNKIKNRFNLSLKKIQDLDPSFMLQQTVDQSYTEQISSNEMISQIRKSKRLQKLVQALHFYLGVLEVRQQQHFGNLSVDIYLPSYKTCIEIDGPRHFVYQLKDNNIKINYNKSTLLKNKVLRSSGLKVFRINNSVPQTEFLVQMINYIS